MFSLQFGSGKTLGAAVGCQPTYVYPPSLKWVVREVVSGNLVDSPDPTHAGVSSVIENNKSFFFLLTAITNMTF